MHVGTQKIGFPAFTFLKISTDYVNPKHAVIVQVGIDF